MIGRTHILDICRNCLNCERRFVQEAELEEQQLDSCLGLRSSHLSEEIWK